MITEDGPWRGSTCLCHPLSSTRGFGPCNRPLLAHGGVVKGLLLVTALPLPRGRGAGGLRFVVSGDRLLVCHLYAQRSSVHGGPSSTGCAFLCHSWHRVRGGPRVTGRAILHPGLWDNLRFLPRRRSLVFIHKANSHCRQLCSRHAVADRAPFPFAGVPVARLSAAPGSLSASSDEEAQVSSHHEVGTGLC